MSFENHNVNYQELAEKIKCWGKELGFDEIGISDIDLTDHEDKLTQWLENGYHGEMDYMAKHGLSRARPADIHPNTIRVISARMNYLPQHAKFAKILSQPTHAYISRYALGRDYHKLLRKRLKQLGDKISQHCEQLDYRPFVDSAPILERPLAEKAGLGWTGKHSLLIDKTAGSWFFLGELLVNIPLPTDTPKSDGCGSCVACLKICPTGAIVAPYVVDARRCISYLTIELKGAIPLEFRPLLGNRIYGCDDCQLICPWNKFAQLGQEDDFQPRQNLDEISLLSLFNWDETSFLKNTEGSPIRRIGYECWQRNIAVALGNAPASVEIIAALKQQRQQASALVAEHIDWAISEQNKKQHAQQQTIAVVEPNARLTARLTRSIKKGLPRDA